MEDVQHKLEVILPAALSVGPFWIDSQSRRPPGTPFDQLPRTVVVASQTETLRALLGRAGNDLGVGLLRIEKASRAMQRRSRWPRKAPNWEKVTCDPKNLDLNGRFESHLRFAAFVLSGDEDRGPAVLKDKRLHLTRVATVDSRGLARWDVHPLDATLDDLVRAHQAGLLDGDPLRPYLIVAVPAGDLGILGMSWASFEDAFNVLWDVTAALGTTYSASQALKAIRRRLGSAKGVVDSNKDEWAKRGGRPSDLAEVLSAKPRSAVETAGLLGCSVSEAEALLWGLGFEVAVDGLWRSGNASDDEVLAVVKRLLSQERATDIELVRAEIEEALKGLSGHQDPPHTQTSPEQTGP